MIPNKFLCYQTEAGFLEDLNNNLIQDSSVVMVLEGPFFYTHGVKFHCSITPEAIEFIEFLLTSSILEINDRIDDNERTIAGVIGDLKSSSLINGKQIIGSNLEITKFDIGLGNVDNTSDSNKPISTATQTALNNKVDKISGKGLSTNDYTTEEKNKLAGITAGAQVNTVTSVAGKTGAVTLGKGDVGLGNVDNTSDANKPISTATQTALDKKVDKVDGKGLSTNDYTTTEKNKLSGIEAGAQVNTVNSVAGKTGAVTLSKSDVGLGNVDNTSDLSKPVSTATQTALNTLKTDVTKTLSLKVSSTEVIGYNGTAAKTINFIGGNSIKLSVNNGNVEISWEGDLDEISYWISKSVSELKEELCSSNKATAMAINDLRKQIFDLQKQIDDVKKL